MNRTLTIALTLFALGAATADAQNAPGFQPYADGGIAADLDFNSYDDSPLSRPALIVGLGTSFGRIWTVRFEATVPAWHEAAFRDTFGCGCSEISPRFTRAGREAHRVITYGVLLGRDFAPARRVQITPVLGLGIANHADREEGRFAMPPA